MIFEFTTSMDSISDEHTGPASRVVQRPVRKYGRDFEEQLLLDVV